MRRRTQPRDPLAPVEFLATFLLASVALTLLLTSVFALFGSGSFVGEGQPCLQVQGGAVSAYQERQRDTGSRTSAPLPTGTRLHTKLVSVCAADVPDRVWRRIPGVTDPAPHPTAEQRWWNRLVVWPQVLYGMGALTFVWLLARRARREGFFVPSVAQGLTRLGTFLTLGSVVTSVVVLLASKQLLDTLLPTGGYWDIGLNLSWSTLLTGVGIVTLGRVMGHAVAMREDLDATV